VDAVVALATAVAVDPVTGSVGRAGMHAGVAVVAVVPSAGFGLVAVAVGVFAARWHRVPLGGGRVLTGRRATYQVSPERSVRVVGEGSRLVDLVVSRRFLTGIVAQRPTGGDGGR
jgi:hypothetical protein